MYHLLLITLITVNYSTNEPIGRHVLLLDKEKCNAIDSIGPLLPQGKYHYTCLPQGFVYSTYFF